MAAVVNSVCIAALFVIAHDAAHGSLTPVPYLNRLIGRLSFLPSLQPLTSWEHTHNGLHHAWTNVRGKDPGYAPFTKEEFDDFSFSRRLLERFYRTALGLGLFYFVEVWWKFEIFPARERRCIRSFWKFQADRLLIIAYFTTEVTVLLHFTKLSTRHFEAEAMIILIGVVLRYAIWNWIIGFITFQHHTHQSVCWYKNENDWSFFAGQIRSSVHLQFPRIVEMVLHNVLDHTAHHVDPKIPLL